MCDTTEPWCLVWHLTHYAWEIWTRQSHRHHFYLAVTFKPVFKHKQSHRGSETYWRRKWTEAGSDETERLADLRRCRRRHLNLRSSRKEECQMLKTPHRCPSYTGADSITVPTNRSAQRRNDTHPVPHSHALYRRCKSPILWMSAQYLLSAWVMPNWEPGYEPVSNISLMLVSIALCTFG